MRLQALITVNNSHPVSKYILLIINYLIGRQFTAGIFVYPM